MPGRSDHPKDTRGAVVTIPVPGKDGWVPLFRAGTWTGANGYKRTYSVADLKSAASTFEELYPSTLRPPIFLGSHDKGIAPSVGGITAMKVVGEFLMGKLTMLDKARAAIKKKLYRKLSVGLWFDWATGDKKYPIVVNHLAIVNMPAVTGLGDLDAYMSVAFSADDIANDTNVTTEEFSLEEDEMEKTLKELAADIATLTGTIATMKSDHATELKNKDSEFSAKLTKMEKDLKTAADEKAAADKKVETERFAAVQTKVSAAITKAKEEKKLSPKGEEIFTAVALALDGTEAEFSGKKENLLDKFLDTLNAAKPIADFSEKAAAGGEDDEDELTEFEKDMQAGGEIVTGKAASKDAEDGAN